MAKWKYTITNGTHLREAIEDGNSVETAAKLIDCCNELLSKFSRRDKEDFEEDIQDIIDTLLDVDLYNPEEIDDCLSDFYNICDYIRAFVAL